MRIKLTLSLLAFFVTLFTTCAWADWTGYDFTLVLKNKTLMVNAVRPYGDGFYLEGSPAGDSTKYKIFIAINSHTTPDNIKQIFDVLGDFGKLELRIPIEVQAQGSYFVAAELIQQTMLTLDPAETSAKPIPNGHQGLNLNDMISRYESALSSFSYDHLNPPPVRVLSRLLSGKEITGLEIPGIQNQEYVAYAQKEMAWLGSTQYWDVDRSAGGPPESISMGLLEAEVEVNLPDMDLPVIKAAKARQAHDRAEAELNRDPNIDGPLPPDLPLVQTGIKKISLSRLGTLRQQIIDDFLYNLTNPLGIAPGQAGFIHPQHASVLGRWFNTYNYLNPSVVTAVDGAGNPLDRLGEAIMDEKGDPKKDPSGNVLHKPTRKWTEVLVADENGNLKDDRWGKEGFMIGNRPSAGSVTTGGRRAPLPCPANYGSIVQ